MPRRPQVRIDSRERMGGPERGSPGSRMPGTPQAKLAASARAGDAEAPGRRGSRLCRASLEREAPELPGREPPEDRNARGEMPPHAVAKDARAPRGTAPRKAERKEQVPRWPGAVARGAPLVDRRRQGDLLGGVRHGSTPPRGPTLAPRPAPTPGVVTSPPWPTAHGARRLRDGRRLALRGVSLARGMDATGVTGLPGERLDGRRPALRGVGLVRGMDGTGVRGLPGARLEGRPAGRLGAGAVHRTTGTGGTDLRGARIGTPGGQANAASVKRARVAGGQGWRRRRPDCRSRPFRTR